MKLSTLIILNLISQMMKMMFPEIEARKIQAGQN
jgi:hypothetical protein